MAEFRSQAEKVPAQMPHPVVPKIKVIVKKLWSIVKMTPELDLRAFTLKSWQLELQQRY